MLQGVRIVQGTIQDGSSVSKQVNSKAVISFGYNSRNPREKDNIVPRVVREGSVYGVCFEDAVTESSEFREV